MTEAMKNISLNRDYSYLVIAKQKILTDEYKEIKETLFSDFKRIK